MSQHFSALVLRRRSLFLLANRDPFDLEWDAPFLPNQPLRDSSAQQRYTRLADPCLVIAQNWPGDDPHAPGLTHLVPFFKFARVHHISLPDPKGSVQIESTGNAYSLNWVERPARAFNFQAVIAAISNADHALNYDRERLDTTFA